MKKYQQLQQPIDEAIVNAMIISTPESWKEIVLEIWHEETNPENFELSHSITSPEGYPPVAPDISLFEATFKLEKLIEKNGSKLKKAIYIARNDGDDWHYKANFEYQKQ